MPPLTSLSLLEERLLMSVRLKSQLEPEQLARVARLMHLGLVEQTPAGFRLTTKGETACDRAAHDMLARSKTGKQPRPPAAKRSACPPS